MLEKEIRRRIYNKLEGLDEVFNYNIEALCECRAVIENVLMLYYWDHREDLKDAEWRVKILNN